MFDCYKALQSIEAMCKDMVQPDSADHGIEDAPERAATFSPAPADYVSDSIDIQPVTLRRSPSSTGDHREEPVNKFNQTSSLPTTARPARTVFSAWQLAQLEQEYSNSRYLSSAQRRQLSSRLQLAESTVKVWFQNRRMKEKRQHSESQVHYLNQLMSSYMYQLHCASGLNQISPASATALPTVREMSPTISSPAAYTGLLFQTAAYPGHHQLSPTLSSGESHQLSSSTPTEDLVTIGIKPSLIHSPVKSPEYSPEQHCISSVNPALYQLSTAPVTSLSDKYTSPLNIQIPAVTDSSSISRSPARPRLFRPYAL